MHPEGGEKSMKISYLRSSVVVLLVLTAAIMGCTSSNMLSSNSTQANGASSSLPQVGSTVSASSVFGTNYTWFEYRSKQVFMNTTDTSDMKTVRSISTFQGKPAIIMETTSTISTEQGPGQVVDDTYYDIGMDTMLGGTKTATIDGHNVTYSISLSPLQTKGMNFFTQGSQLTFAGINSVVVPAGFYPNAYKYTQTLSQTEFTSWAVSGIPVPVKETASYPRGEGNFTIELEGWG